MRPSARSRRSAGESGTGSSSLREARLRKSSRAGFAFADPGLSISVFRAARRMAPGSPA
jgi:hypothetical protein